MPNKKATLFMNLSGVLENFRTIWGFFFSESLARLSADFVTTDVGYSPHGLTNLREISVTIKTFLFWIGR